MINISMHEQVDNGDLVLHVTVPRSHVMQGKVTRHSLAIASRVDTQQFFGMIRDAIHLKLGLEYEPTGEQT